MQKINMTIALNNRKGEELKENGEPVILRDVLLMTIDGSLPGDDSLESRKKLRLFKLGQKVALEDEMSFTAEDITLLLERANKVFPAMVYGQIVSLLDPSQLDD